MVSSVFPTMFDGQFFEGILLLGIFLVKVWKVVNPFLSKKHSIALSMGRDIPATFLFATM